MATKGSEPTYTACTACLTRHANSSNDKNTKVKTLNFAGTPLARAKRINDWAAVDPRSLEKAKLNI